jgi:hypothetical protein
MTSSHAAYLAAIEAQAETCLTNDLLLWPRTPIGDEIQQKIVQRVGVSDYQAEDPGSRPNRIIAILCRLSRARCIPAKFSVLDIACGDAIVLWQIKRAFPASRCYGADCNKGLFPAHERVARDDVQLSRCFIQHLVEKDSADPFDVVMMLNTYRGWGSADLKPQEHDLPLLVDNWLRKNARYIILSVTPTQLDDWQQAGWQECKLGRGEEDSLLVCFSRQKLPRPWWQRLFGR